MPFTEEQAQFGENKTLDPKIANVMNRKSKNKEHF